MLDSHDLEVILPSQYFGVMGTDRLSSEQKLMLAVLVDAVNVIQAYHNHHCARQRRICAEAQHWVEQTYDGMFTFVGVCDALDINASALRHRLATVGPGRMRLKAPSRTQRMTATRPRATSR